MNYYLILGEELSLIEVSENKKENTIAGTNELPSITFSEEAYKEMKERFGWVDVEREAEIIFPYKETRTDYATEECRKIFIEGFKLCQSINKSRFSEEDMVEFYEWCDTSEEAAIFWRKNRISPDMSGSHYQIIKEKRKELIQLWQQQRQPKRVKVEVEMEEVFFDGNEWKTKLPKRFIDSLVKTKTHPKISNNTIKITRLC